MLKYTVIAKYINLVIVIFYCINHGYSESINSKFLIEIRQTVELNDETIPQKNYIHLNAIYAFANNKDSIIEISYKNVVPQLGLKLIDFNLSDNHNNIISKKQYSIINKNGYLKIVLIKSIADFNINCSFNYLGTTIFMLNEKNKQEIAIYGGSDNFELFDDLFPTINKKTSKRLIEIKAPSNLYILSTLSSNGYKKGYKTYSIDNDSLLSNIVIANLDKNRYQLNKIHFNGNCYNFYTRNVLNESFNIDSIFCKLKDLNNLNCISKTNKHIDIVQMFWEKNGYAYGRVFNKNLMLVDVSFFSSNKKSLIHEILHTIIDLKLNEKSKGYFVLNESLIEYLAIYYANNKDELRVSETFENLRNKKLYNDSIIQDTKSLYEITSNDPHNQDRIYYQGPVIFYDFAKQIGLSKFEKLIVNFAIKLRKNKNITYQDFILFLKKSNINKIFIEEFDKKVHSHKGNFS